MFEQFNNNPGCRIYTRGKKKGKKEIKSDCVIRCMQLAWNTDWLTAAKRLAERSFELYEPQCANATFESFCEPTQIKAKTEDLFSGRKRYKTVKEFAESTKGHSIGFIVSVPHHLVFVKNGKYYDAWDSGRETVRKIWKLKENNQ